jgi:hypothetical protein
MSKTISLILCTFIIILSLSSCLGPSTYQFNNIQLSDSHDEKTLKLTDSKTTFPSNTPIIYGQTTFVNPNEGKTTYIQVNFSLLDENGEAEIVDSSTKTTQNGGTMIFEGKRPGFSWSTGQYVVDFIINNETIARYEFTIVSTGTSQLTEKSNWATDYQTSLTVDSNHDPINPSSKFQTTDNQIQLSLSATSSMPKNTTVKVDWYYLDNQKLIISQEQTISKNQRVHFTLDKTYTRNFLQANGDWPSGSYKADIYFDDTLVTMVQFKIGS